MELNKLSDLIAAAKSKEIKTLAVAAAEDEHVLMAVRDAVKEGITQPILVGNSFQIQVIAEKIGFNLLGIEIIHDENLTKSCQIAVKLVKEGRAHFLMKGLVPTATIMRAVLDKEQGLRTGNVISHVALLECPGYHKILGITDAAMNIAPTLEEKVSIINNATEMFRRLGVECPKVAVIGAVEVVNPKMSCTVDAAQLTVMNMRNQIKKCIVEGPLALDNAVSREACEHKGIDTRVGGEADILLLPDIEAGNVLYKSITFLGRGEAAGVILGAKVPVVLTSRADSEEAKLYSIACAAAIS